MRAAVARANAHLKDRRAALVRASYDLRLLTLDLVQQIEILQRSRQAALIQMDFVDMNLDRRQAEYELEIQTTLGDAMTRLSETEFLATRVDYDLVLAWARLDALSGQLIPDRMEKSP